MKTKKANVVKAIVYIATWLMALSLLYIVVFKVRVLVQLINNFMIRESEVKYCICSHVPALAIELSHNRYNHDAYKAIDRLTDYTKAAIYEDNSSEIEECFKTAYQLLHEGNKLVQLAVENIFIYTVSRLLEIQQPVAQSVRSCFLKSFEKEYSKLINSRNP